jgi:N-acetylated-alpha-linked acidic dipeptidase
MLKFFLYPGDPGASSAQDQTLSTLPRIPAIPISEQIAMELLKRIHGSNAPQEWRGWLPVDYPIGAGPARVRASQFKAAHSQFCVTFCDHLQY